MADFDVKTKEENHDDADEIRDQSKENACERKKSEVHRQVPESEGSDLTIALRDGLSTTFQNGHVGSLHYIRIEENCAIIAGEDGKIYIWDIVKKTQCHILAGHSDCVTGLAIVTNDSLLDPESNLPLLEKIIVSGSADGTIKLWTLKSQELKSFLTNNIITCLDVIKEKIIITGTDTGKLIARKLNNCNIVNSIDAHPQSVQFITVEPNTKFLATVGSKICTLKIWVFDNNVFKLKYTFTREEQLKTVRCVSMSQNMLFVGDDTDHLKIINWRNGKVTALPNGEKKQGTTGLFVTGDYLLSTSFSPSLSGAILSIRRMPTFEYECSIKCDMGLAFAIAYMESTDGLKFVIGGSELGVVSYSPPIEGDDLNTRPIQDLKIVDNIESETNLQNKEL